MRTLGPSKAIDVGQHAGAGQMWEEQSFEIGGYGCFPVHGTLVGVAEDTCMCNVQLLGQAYADLNLFQFRHDAQ